MNKILLVLLFTVSYVFALTGEAVFEKYCMACHLESSNINEDQAILKAPPMNRVSERIKMKTSSKEEFLSFVDDYIQDPSAEKGLCRPRAYKRFGVMPPIGKAMSKDERQVISKWLYRHFKDPSSSVRSCANEDQ